MATPIKIRNLVAPAGGSLVVTGPANIKWVQVLNSTAATCFVQLFNATAGITLGTTTPDLEFEVAAGANSNNSFVDGALFSAGISAASTTTEGGNVASASGVEVFIGV